RSSISYGRRWVKAVTTPGGPRRFLFRGSGRDHPGHLAIPHTLPAKLDRREARVLRESLPFVLFAEPVDRGRRFPSRECIRFRPEREHELAAAAEHAANLAQVIRRIGPEVDGVDREHAIKVRVWERQIGALTLTHLHSRTEPTRRTTHHQFGRIDTRDESVRH